MYIYNSRFIIPIHYYSQTYPLINHRFHLGLPTGAPSPSRGRAALGTSWTSFWSWRRSQRNCCWRWLRIVMGSTMPMCPGSKAKELNVGRRGICLMGMICVCVCVYVFVSVYIYIYICTCICILHITGISNGNVYVYV